MASAQPKKRGRKKENKDIYTMKAQEKIEDIKSQLKDAKRNGISVKERLRLRNLVSAQQSRLKKKEEIFTLNQMIISKDTKFKILNDILLKHLKTSPDLMSDVMIDIEKQWPIGPESDYFMVP